MLSDEEIEKAKEMLSNPKKQDLIEIIRIFKRNGIENYCITKNETIETLLQYIDQLEQENNKQNKIIDEIAKYTREPYIFSIYKSRMEKIKDNSNNILKRK